ncbi:cell separation during budding, partial [Ascosphaera acerosa]
FTQSAIQSLIDNPLMRRTAADPKFAGRDWTQITIGELARPTDLQFVEADVSIEDATSLLIQNTDTRCLLIRENQADRSVIGTFDFADLNAYLLLVVGLAQPETGRETAFREVARKAKEGLGIPLRDVKTVAPSKEPLVMLPESANLRKAVETFGGGVHRIVVVKEDSTEVVGIFTQLRLVKFLWTNGESFPVIDRLYPQTLNELKVCSQQVPWISGEKPLYQALQILHNEGLSSVAVVDHQMNVLGNISIVDVKLLTTSSSLPLLNNTCAHFVSIILSTRGLVDGQDSYPVFHVNPNATLAHTIAKLAATKSHRMWVTNPQSPASTNPPTPGAGGVTTPQPQMHVQSSTKEPQQQQQQQPPLPIAPVPPPSLPTSPSPTQPAADRGAASVASSSGASSPLASATPYLPAVPQGMEKDLPPPAAPPTLTMPQPVPGSSSTSLSSLLASTGRAPTPPVSAAGKATTAAVTKPCASVPMPGARLSGRLVGLVSLTDVLNLYARASGLSPLDPSISRNRRRRTSSSSSMGVRMSGDLARELTDANANANANGGGNASSSGTASSKGRPASPKPAQVYHCISTTADHAPLATRQCCFGNPSAGAITASSQPPLPPPQRPARGYWGRSQCPALIVSSAFQGKTLLARHRLVNAALKDEIAQIHAWTPRCLTPEQWEKEGRAEI